MVELPEKSGLMQTVQVDYNVISPDYFKTAGMSVRRGREFTGEDHKGSAGVSVINEQMAHRFWPGQDPVGKRFRLTSSKAGSVEVIGIVKDGRFRSLRDPVRPCFYAPLEQHTRREMSLMVRTAGDPLQHVAIAGYGRSVGRLYPRPPRHEDRSHGGSAL